MSCAVYLFYPVCGLPGSFECVEVAETAAEVQAEALAKGSPWPDMDLLVALSAKKGSELLTSDEDQLAMKAALSKVGVAVSEV